MIKLRGALISIGLGAALGLGPYSAAAEHEADKLKRAAGAYVYAAEIVSQFRRSRCGRSIESQTPEPARVIEEVARHLSADDVAELRLFFAGEGFREARRDNRELFEAWFQSLASRNHDELTACATIEAEMVKLYDRAEQKREAAKKSARGD